MIWTGFVLGIAGSLHCIGMCGPIVFALPGTGSGWRILPGRMLYNGGRVITYAFMGLIMGLIGESISLGGYQRPLSIIMGVMILSAILLPARFMQRFYPAGTYLRISSRLKSFWGTWFKKNSHTSLLVIGILNGFLPCGLVYMALAGSLATASLAGGVSYMLFFGVGTIPVMLAASFLGNFIGLRLRRTINRFLPVGAALIAVLFILRGMALGIPYLSPPADLSRAPVLHQGEKMDHPPCCNPESPSK